MPTFRVTVLNETFESCNHHQAAEVSDAVQRAIRGALEIGVEEISKGKSFFGAEVKVENGDVLVGRYVVSVGASPLQSPRA
jgi:hypothetical protein